MKSICANLINAIRSKLRLRCAAIECVEGHELRLTSGRSAKKLMMGIEKLGFCRASSVRAVVQTTCANPALLTITCWYPCTTFKALFATARGAKFKALRGILGSSWSRGSHGQSG